MLWKQLSCTWLILLHCLQLFQCINDVCREADNRKIRMMPSSIIEHIIWPHAASKDVIDSIISNIAQKRKPVIIEGYTLDKDILLPLNNILNELQDTKQTVIKSNKNCPILEYYHEDLPLRIGNWKKPNIDIYNLTLNEIQDILSIQSKHIYNNREKHDSFYKCNDEDIEINDYYVLTMNLLNYTDELSILKDTFSPKHILIDRGSDNNNKNLYQDEEFEGINLWFGYYGFLTQLHYDSSDNFNIQIKGKKLFRIISPKYYEKLYLYPWLHPLSRKSQLPHSSMLQYRFKDENDWKFFKDVEIYEIELNEGEVLYLPPFWFHEVISINYPLPSLNINVISHSIEQLFQHYLFKFPVMINSDKNSSNYFLINALSLKTFFSHLLDEFGWNYKKIIHQFIKSSYDPLFKNLNDNDLILKYKKKMKKMCNKIKQIESNTLCSNDIEKYQELIKWYNEEIIKKNKFEVYSKQIHEWMMKNKGPHTQMMIVSYIEIFTHQFLPTNSIYYFFKYCF